MKKRILSVALALCLCISSHSVVYAYQETPSPQEEVLTEESADESDTGDNIVTVSQEAPLPQEEVLTEESTDGPDIDNGAGADTVLQEGLLLQEEVFAEESTDGPVTYNSGIIPTPTEVYNAMTALKDQDAYKEGTTWTNDEPYPDATGDYHWNGGTINGVNISAVGCVAFAFVLSDAAFGSLPARMYSQGEFAFADIKVGDILRVNNDAHTVIVLEVSDAGVVVAEGNYNGTVHWGRAISKEEVMRDASHYITRYPEGYISPDDPEANVSIAAGTFDGGLTWNLTKSGTLTISGVGAMPDFSGVEDQPWSNNGSRIRKVVIGDGVTGIGSCAFRNCGILSVEIPDSVTAIGSSAFQSSSLISVTIPSGVATVGDSAFCDCKNLSTVTVSEGVETIGQNAFQACTSLTTILLPASIEEVGAAAFWQCGELESAIFTSGSKQVKLGDNIFMQCYYLTRVTLPSNIDRIGTGMFVKCLMLSEVEIPQGVDRIGESAFSSCSRLVKVIIPDSVKTIERAAFANCALKDIYFTGTEEQWNSIDKLADTASAVSTAMIHYNYTPATSPDPNPDDGDDNENGSVDNPGSDPGDNTGNTPGNNPDSNPGDNPNNTPGDASDNNSGSDSSDNVSNNTDSDSGRTESSQTASVIKSGIKTVAETWKPATSDEIKRYACMGKEAIQYTLPKDNAYRVTIENTMQGPLCFQSFESVLGDYTIGRTYNVYALSDTIYSMDEEIQFTIKIPSAIYKDDREYKMICVTKDGQPIVYSDSDSDPETITIKTNKFYAYALVYRQKQK